MSYNRASQCHTTGLRSVTQQSVAVSNNRREREREWRKLWCFLGVGNCPPPNLTAFGNLKVMTRKFQGNFKVLFKVLFKVIAKLSLQLFIKYIEPPTRKNHFACPPTHSKGQFSPLMTDLCFLSGLYFGRSSSPIIRQEFKLLNTFDQGCF